MKKKPTIDPSDADFGVVLTCAVRYSIGRQTYMPKLVMDFIRPLLPWLSGRALGVMRRDIENAGDYGADFDEMEWLEFLREIVAERERREA